MASREPTGSPAAAPASRRRGKGPGGSSAYPRLAGEVGVAGGKTGGEQSAAASRVSAEETAAQSATPGVSGRFRGRGGRGQRGRGAGGVGVARGRPELAGDGGNSGGGARDLRVFSGDRARKRGREWGKRDGTRGAGCRLQGLISVARAASRRWQRRSPGSLHAPASRRRQHTIANSPFDFGFFF
jgi:hypothetical protein